MEIMTARFSILTTKEQANLLTQASKTMSIRHCQNKHQEFNNNNILNILTTITRHQMEATHNFRISNLIKILNMIKLAFSGLII
jgi:hypothetical protein